MVLIFAELISTNCHQPIVSFLNQKSDVIRGYFYLNNAIDSAPLSMFKVDTYTLHLYTRSSCDVH